MAYEYLGNPYKEQKTLSDYMKEDKQFSQQTRAADQQSRLSDQMGQMNDEKLKQAKVEKAVQYLGMATPENWGSIRMQAIQEGLGNEQTIPMDFDPNWIQNTRQAFDSHLSMARLGANGGSTGALLDRLVDANRNAGNTDYNLTDALRDLKGGAGQAGKNDANIATGDEANYQTQSGKNRSDLEYNPLIKKAESKAEAEGKLNVENQETLGNLQNMKDNIQVAKELIPTVSATGPILGRAGALAEDPQYRNLQGALNSITLLAKDLYNLGSGQGFTDADRDFLQEIVGGKYARAETIGLALDRMDKLIDKRSAYLQQQNTQLTGGDSQPTTGNATSWEDYF